MLALIVYAKTPKIIKPVQLKNIGNTARPATIRIKTIAIWGHTPTHVCYSHL